MSSPSYSRLIPLVVAVVALPFASTACAPRAEQIFGTGPNGERTVRLEVANRNFSDATVYVLRHADRMRAGVVTGMGRASFRVPWASAAPLQVEIRLTDGDRCTTREIPVEPGDLVSVEIPQDVRSDPNCTVP